MKLKLQLLDCFQCLVISLGNLFLRSCKVRTSLIRSSNYESFHIYIFNDSFLSRAHKTHKLTPDPNVDGFIAQLAENRTGDAKVMGSNPVETRFFFGLKLQLL